MSLESAVSLLTSFVGIGVTVLLAGIPWAYSVHGRLATIEASLRDAVAPLARLNEVEQRMLRLEMQWEHRVQ
jgi:hypothetical protein